MKWAKCILLSTVSMIVAGCLLLSAAALLCAKTGKLPRGSLVILTTALACGVVFLGGFLSSLAMREKGILLGLISGLVFLLVAAVLSFAVFKSGIGPSSIGKIAALLLSGSIGGVMGVNKKSKVKF